MPLDSSFLTDRAQRLEASGIRKFFDLTASMPDAVNLSIGQAHFDVPDAVKKVAVDAIDAGFNRYTVTQGIPELRERLQKHLRETYAIGDDNDDLFATCGVSGGLLLAYMCLLQPGDEIALPDPYFVMYVHLANQTGAKPVFYDIYPDFKVTAERVERALTDRTKVLLINSPSNPTGVVSDTDELKAIADLARRRNLIVITDEIYDVFMYDQKQVSIKQFYPEGTLYLGGASKTWGMPGWRVGWALGPNWLLEKMKVLQQFSYVCAPAPFQKAVTAALDVDMSAHIDAYRKKRDMVVAGLSEHYNLAKPGGTFYAFPEIPEALRAPDPKWGTQFAAKTLGEDRPQQDRVIVVPGTACSRKSTHYRISFAVPDDKLAHGIDILRQVAEGKL